MVQKGTLAYMIKLFSTRVPRTFIGERTVFSTNGIGENWISTYRKVKLNHTYTK